MVWALLIRSLDNGFVGRYDAEGVEIIRVEFVTIPRQTHLLLRCVNMWDSNPNNHSLVNMPTVA